MSGAGGEESAKRAKRIQRVKKFINDYENQLTVDFYQYRHVDGADVEEGIKNLYVELYNDEEIKPEDYPDKFDEYLLKIYADCVKNAAYGLEVKEDKEADYLDLDVATSEEDASLEEDPQNNPSKPKVKYTESLLGKVDVPLNQFNNDLDAAFKYFDDVAKEMLRQENPEEQSKEKLKERIAAQSNAAKKATDNLKEEQKNKLDKVRLDFQKLNDVFKQFEAAGARGKDKEHPEGSLAKFYGGIEIPHDELFPAAKINQVKDKIDKFEQDLKAAEPKEWLEYANELAEIDASLRELVNPVNEYTKANPLKKPDGTIAPFKAIEMGEPLVKPTPASKDALKKHIQDIVDATKSDIAINSSHILTNHAVARYILDQFNSLAKENSLTEEQKNVKQELVNIFQELLKAKTAQELDKSWQESDTAGLVVDGEYENRFLTVGNEPVTFYSTNPVSKVFGKGTPALAYTISKDANGNLTIKTDHGWRWRTKGTYEKLHADMIRAVIYECDIKESITLFGGKETVKEMYIEAMAEKQFLKWLKEEQGVDAGRNYSFEVKTEKPEYKNEFDASSKIRANIESRLEAKKAKFESETKVMNTHLGGRDIASADLAVAKAILGSDDSADATPQPHKSEENAKTVGIRNKPKP